MGRIRKYTRRAFIVSSAAVAGGVAFGVYMAKKPLENPLKPKAGAVTLNPYLIIDQEGVTIIAPRAEMGQGVQSTLAALVAEELDVAWKDVRVLHGPAAQAYYNGALITGHAEYEDGKRGAWQEFVRDAMDVVPKTLGLQVTGGSTATIDAFEKMRLAGATAREALKLAAAERLSGALRTENGQVIGADGSAIAYADLAEAAAKITPPRDVTLRPASQWKYLGRDMPRVDMVAKSTGTAQYGADVRLEGMKFATVRINPRLGAGMKSYDASTAERMAGVQRVIDLGNGIAVVASNTWLAFQAADAVQIDWEEAPYPATTDGLFAAIEASLDEAPNSTLRDDGDTSVTPEGAIEISAEYRVPYLAHATMEPMNATALFTGDALEIWCGNQAPLVLADKAADAAGLSADQVTVHTLFMGGGFGRRAEADVAILAAKVAKEMPDAPVKVMWSREEDMRHDFYRPAAIARMKGAVKDGEAVLFDARIAAPSVTKQSMSRIMGFAPPGPDPAHVEGAANQPYDIANYRVAGHLADVDVPVGFWRSVGNSFNGFFHESFIDELAHAAGADPLQFRFDHIAPLSPPTAKLLNAVRDMSGWSGKTPDGIGRGVAVTWSFGTPVAQVIEVADSDAGIRITKAWIACDVGTALDPRNIRAQMEGGMIYGLSAAVHGEITFADGEVEQENFPDYDALRMGTAPVTQVQVFENNVHMGGVGEPGTPPSMPALANALFDLTGKRARELPLSKLFDFAG
ncbi:xanthine dehydrogenase family protein molybdopterin-binding subunit [Profundibacter amoris]|uniref:Xanthine dehydrogenase family protein molybdopterin-binding subunit n=1 Tax=Profundibacter amoris TaxID=2171755 RepID=A0A347UF35_9RHOB|nr:molybdopterin cofactor-binding domain-containing protein [Profundibacter amoris]AXX97463.1 xanthine dehydrogenase family protein molybdopterin-binding subunit [Profundibacter amoris]